VVVPAALQKPPLTLRGSRADTQNKKTGHPAFLL